MEIHAEDIPRDYAYHPKYHNNGKEKLSVENSSALEMYREKNIHAVQNPLAFRSMTSTIVLYAGVTIFLSWIYYIYRGYMNWWRNPNGDEVLPDTSMVSVGIPLLLGAFVVEFIIYFLMGVEYRWNDVTCSFDNGLLQQLFVMLTKSIGTHYGMVLITAIPYKYIFDNYRIANIDGTIGFILMFFGRDFCYYWLHLALHRVGPGWAIHSVHHAPNSYNFSVNLSQGVLQRVAGVPFYVPLALFFPPELYLLLFAPEKLYGGFTHTKLVGKTYTGINRIFVTPSSHRSHHAGRPAKYIDKQYGEMLTIWDRLFGTFVEESEPIVFGHVMPMTKWNPLTAQIKYWVWMWDKSKTTSSVIEKIKCFIYPPGYMPGEERELPLLNGHPWNSEKYDERMPTNFMAGYVLVHWFGVISWGLWLLGGYTKLSGIGRLTLALYSAYSVIVFGYYWDRSQYTKTLEYIRLILMPFALVYVAIYGFGLSADTCRMVLIGSFAVSVISMMFVHNMVGLEKKAGEGPTMIIDAGRAFTERLAKEKAQLEKKKQD